MSKRELLVEPGLDVVRKSCAQAEAAVESETFPEWVPEWVLG